MTTGHALVVRIAQWGITPVCAIFLLARVFHVHLSVLSGETRQDKSSLLAIAARLICSVGLYVLNRVPVSIFPRADESS